MGTCCADEEEEGQGVEPEGHGRLIVDGVGLAMGDLTYVLVVYRTTVLLSMSEFEGYIALNRALHACDRSRSLRRGAEVEDCRQLASSSRDRARATPHE